MLRPALIVLGISFLANLACADTATFHPAPGLWSFTVVMSVAGKDSTEDQKFCLKGDAPAFDTATYVRMVAMGATCDITEETHRETSSDIYLKCTNGPLKMGHLLALRKENDLKLQLKGVFDPGNGTEISGQIVADLVHLGDCPPQ